MTFVRKCSDVISSNKIHLYNRAIANVRRSYLINLTSQLFEAEELPIKRLSTTDNRFIDVDS